MNLEIINIIKKKLKEAKKKLNWTSLGVFISLIALFFSFKSYKLSLEQYNNSKIGIYRAELNNDKESMKLIPYSDEIYLQLAEIYLPTDLNSDRKSFQVDNSDYTLYLQLLILELESFLREEISIDEGNIGALTFSIPIVINSNYIHNGVIYNGRGLYHLYMDATVDDKGEVKIYLKSIIYERNIENNKDVLKLLDSIWEKSYKKVLTSNWNE